MSPKSLKSPGPIDDSHDAPTLAENGEGKGKRGRKADPAKVDAKERISAYFTFVEAMGKVKSTIPNAADLVKERLNSAMLALQDYASSQGFGPKAENSAS